MKKILQKGNAVLRKKAVEVPAKDMGSNKIKKIIKDLAEALSKEPTGVAIAAPQIGESLQIFLIAKHKLNPEADSENSLPARLAEAPAKRTGGQKEVFMIFINPKISKISRKKNTLQEGCLSVKGTYGDVKRAEKITVEAFDEKGKKFKRGASGFLAEAIQHEIDHLNGVLFIDRATDIKNRSNSAIDKN